MIEVRGLTKTYGAVKALDQVTMSLRRGEVLGLIGHSGSGKTTLLRVIAGLDKADSGTVSIDGAPASVPEVVIEPSSRNISVVFQVPALWPHMTVSQNIAFTIEDLPAAEREARVTHLLEAAGIAGYGDRRINELSGGEARRVSILRGLAPRKPYLLMDEPLVNLDPELKTEIHDLIRSEVEGAGVLFVTHEQDELEGFADRQLRIKGGRVEE